MVLVTNAIAILSEDRFLARIGWSASSATEPAFGAGPGDTSVKSKIVNLIASVRTLMRSMSLFSFPFRASILGARAHGWVGGRLAGGELGG